MIADTRPLSEITQDGLRALYCELGLVNTVRFLNQFTAGFGDYTEERRTLLGNQTLNEVLADIHQYQSERDLHPQDIPSAGAISE